VKYLNGRLKNISLNELAAEIRECHIQSSRREQFVRDAFNCMTTMNTTLFEEPILVTPEAVDFVLDGGQVRSIPFACHLF
jgi:hypothetical protein